MNNLLINNILSRGEVTFCMGEVTFCMGEASRARKDKMQKRKNIRLKEYDYSSKGMYFITICTKDKKNIFGKIVDYKMLFNNYGNQLNDILESFDTDKYVIDYYQIMPNHIHFIVEIKNNKAIDLAKIISQIKSKCTNLLKYKNLWQRNYYERVVRDEKEYNNIVKYINENPYMDKYNW